MIFSNSVKSLQRFLLVVLGVIAMSGLQAQTVTGTVTSASEGGSLPSATVLVKGTTTGTFTDENGRFSIAAGPDATLVFTFIGYERLEVPVNGRSTINVELEARESTLDEVVVTGYGTQRAREVSSAITSVKAEDFNVGQVNDPTQLIQGKVAGLNISRVGGDPNSGFTLRLRGISTFGANAEPLIVIDGVIGGSLNSVDPADIADISVLKDGSAAAIYGSRASAGVILITTKRGVPGSTQVDYNGFVSFEGVDRTLPTLGREEFLALKNSTGAPNVDRGADTDWVGEVTRTGVSHVHNLSLAGGAGGTTYRGSINLRDVRGVGIVSGFTQLNGRFNINQKAFNDRLTINADISNTVRQADYGFQEAYRYANLYNPTAPVRSNDPAFENFGGYYQEVNFDYFNPRAILDQNVNEGELKTLLTAVRADFEIIDGLKVGAFVSRQRRSNLYGEYYSRQSFFRGNANPDATGALGRARRYSEDDTNDLLEATVNYVRGFGKTNIDLLGGYSWNELEYQGFGLEGTGIPSDALSYNALGTMQAITDQDVPLSVFSSKNNFRVIGFFGRARINVDDTWNLMASLRYEGSTRFGTGFQWGFFPAVSGSVMLSNFFEVDAVNELKFRVGYGITGALPGASYISLPRFGQSNFFLYEGSYIPAIGPQNNPNPALRWERKGELNVGVDFQLLDYTFFGSIDYFNRAIRDLIYADAPVNSPPFTFPSTTVNLNQVALRSSGLEGTFGYRMESGNFSWSPSLALTYYNPVLLDTVAGVVPDFAFVEIFSTSTSPGAPGLNNNPTQRVQLGTQLGQYYGYLVDLDNLEEGGNWVNIDRNRDGVVNANDQGTMWLNGADTTGRAPTGLPNFSIGFNNSFRIGNLDFGFFLRGDFGHHLLNNYRIFYEPTRSARPIENAYVSDRFENVNASPQINNYFLEKADFLVLDNAQIGYNFVLPGKQKLRAYVAGQNLFWLTRYSGIDPSVRWADNGETDNGGRPNLSGNPLFPGLDRRNIYFTTRTITVGINMTL